MSKSLVIVESRAKAKTIGRYLGGEYEVEACFGHIRDLPKKDLGIDIENDFKPSYEIVPDGRNKKVVSALRKKAASAERVYLAPDPDREGEAIAWHLKQALKLPDDKTFRVTFNEITKSAVQKAFDHPARISLDKVDAQQDRRILDRLVGYQISPLLWKKIPNVAPRTGAGGRTGLSAGRVQSVAVRLIVEREREIEAFIPVEYWRIFALLSAEGAEFKAELEFRDAVKLEVGGGEFTIPNEDAAQAVLAELAGATFVVRALETKESKSNPSAPFTTSTMQQAASTQLSFPAKKTMRLAQQLYEGVDMGEEGPVALITYMRTDSVRVSQEAVSQIRDYISGRFGKRYLPPKPRAYRSKGRAQEAHEAVRPTYVQRTPESVKGFLTADQFKLYDLIWRRAVASQMREARFSLTTAAIDARNYTFTARGRTIVFDGHTILAGSASARDELLPPLAEGRELELVRLAPERKFTQPPPRYSEAGLVKTLEKEGIGRPSTYATIISTIQERHYVEQRKRLFHPTPLGVFLTDKLVKHFPRILDVKFTGRMEDELDLVESGEMDWLKVLHKFYGPFKKSLDRAEKELQPFEETDQDCPECGKQLVKRLSKAGLFLGCSGYPECTYTRNLSRTGGEIDIDLEEKKCPSCGKPLALRGGPRGPFVGCSGYPECTYVGSIEDPEGGAAPAGVEGEAAGGESPQRPCPLCGKPLVVRTGKRGRFLGCSGFPKCRHTESLEGEKDSGAKGGEPEAGASAPQKDCPSCGKPLVVRTGKRGRFLGCSGFPKCRHTEPLEAEPGGSGDAAAAEASQEVPEKKCPNCGKTLVVKTGRRGTFLACPGYPDCRHAESITGVRAKRTPPKTVGRECPECGKDLVHRKGPRGAFVGCSGYPNCRYTERAGGS